MSGTEGDRTLNGFDTNDLPLGYKNLKAKPGFRTRVVEIMADGGWYIAVRVSPSLQETIPIANIEIAKGAIDGLFRNPPITPYADYVPKLKLKKRPCVWTVIFTS